MKRDPLSVAEIRRALANHRLPTSTFRPERRHAAVALILAGGEEPPQICLIRRAERPGDPWSGHVAFPGGRADPPDLSAQAVAERETLEEVGLRLEPCQLIAPLGEIQVTIDGVEIGMVLSPFVYHYGSQPAPLKPNLEVAEAFWTPLEELLDPGRLTRISLARLGRERTFSAVKVEGGVIWGITLRVLGLFAEKIARPLTPPL